MNRSAAAALASVRDAVRTRLWPLPVTAVVVAAVGGVLVPRLDAHVDGDLPSWFAQFMFGGDAGAARTVLDAVSSSLITVTSLTFSLTVVTLQLASSQFSPRLLRTFASDVFVQATLGVFLATFTFSLTALRAVRSSRSGTDEFVPRISVTVSFVLAVVSVVCLVLFLAHLARQIRVETMLRDVHRDAESTASTVLEARSGTPRQPAPTVPADALTLMASSSGFLVRVDAAELLDAARDADAVVVLEARLGDSVVDRTPMGRYWGRQTPLDGDARDRLERHVAAATRTGFERTAAQDIGFGLRQLTDVANKALSPGINDPTTAVHALGHISALLCDLAGRDLGPTLLTDDDGGVRVVLHRPDLAELVDLGISQPRRYGASDPQVMARLFALLGELAWRAHPEDHHVVVDQLRRLRDTVTDQNFDTVERQTLAQHGRAVDDVLVLRADPRATVDRGRAG